MKDGRISRLLNIFDQLNVFYRKNYNPDLHSESLGKFLKVYGPLQDLNKKYQELFPTEKEEKAELDLLDAYDLADLYIKVIKGFEEFDNRPQTDYEIDLLNEKRSEYLVDMESINKTGKLLNDIIENNKKDTLYNVISNSIPNEDLIKEDKNAKKEPDKIESDWDVTKHSVEENIDMYKEGLKNLSNSYVNHINNIAYGEKQEDDQLVYEGPENQAEQIAESHKALTEKLQLIQNAFIYENTLTDKRIDIKPILKDHTNLERFFTPAKMNKTTKIIGKDFMQDMGNIFNEHEKEISDGLDKSVAEGKITKDNANKLKNEVHKLSFTQANLGFSGKDLGTVANISGIIELPSLVLNQFKKTLGNEDYLNDSNNPLFDVGTNAEILHDAILGYLKYDPNVVEVEAEQVTSKDFNQLFESMDTYLKKADLEVVVDEKKAPNPLIEDCLNFCGKMAELMPADFSKKFASTKKQVEDRQKVAQKVDALYAKICQEKGMEVDKSASKTSDFNDIFKAFDSYINTANLLTKETNRVKNTLIDECVLACKEMAKVSPNLAARANELEAVPADRFIVTVNNKIDDIGKNGFKRVEKGNSKSPLSRDVAFHSICTYHKLGFVPEENFQKAYFIKLLRDDKFRAQEESIAANGILAIKDKKPVSTFPATLNGNTNPSEKQIKDALMATYMASKLISHEKACYNNLVANPNGYSLSYLASPYNKKIVDAMDQTIDLTSKQIDGLFDDYQAFLGGESAKEMKKHLFDKTYNLEQVDDSIVEKALYGKNDDFISTLNKDTLEALTQPSGRSRANSKEYNHILEAFANLQTKKHTANGACQEDYEELLNVASDYLNKHETKMRGSNAQKRINAARELLVGLGSRIKEGPLKEQYDKTIKLNMLRCKEFRKLAMDNASKTITKLAGVTGVMDKMKFDRLTVKEKAEFTDAMKTYAYGLKAEELLKAQKLDSRIKGKIASQTVSDMMLAQFKEADDFANKALSENYKDVMLKHGKKVESDNPELKAALKAAAGDKKAKLEFLEDSIVGYKAAMQGFASNKNDAKVLECLSTYTYLKALDDNKELLSNADLANALKPEIIAANSKKFAPFAANYINAMPKITYERLSESGKLCEFAQDGIKKLLKNPEEVIKQYNDNLAKNNGEFKRDEVLPVISGPQK